MKLITIACLVVSLTLLGCSTKNAGTVVTADSTSAAARPGCEADAILLNDRLLHAPSLEDFQKLISAGADIQAAKDSNGNTVLHSAVLNGNLEIIEYLLNNKADLHAINRYDHSVIDAAFCQAVVCHNDHEDYYGDYGYDKHASYPYKEIVDLLLKYGASMNEGKPPLEIVFNSSAYNGEDAHIPEMIKYILEHNAVVNESVLCSIADWIGYEYSDKMNLLNYEKGIAEILVNSKYQLQFSNPCLPQLYYTLKDKNVLINAGVSEERLKDAVESRIPEFVKAFLSSRGQAQSYAEYDPLNGYIDDYQQMADSIADVLSFFEKEGFVLPDEYKQALENNNTVHHSDSGEDSVDLDEDSEESLDENDDNDKEDENLQCPEDKVTLLGNIEKTEGMDHGAWRTLDIKTAKYLLRCGASINEADEDGNTPVFYAESASTVQFLVKNGANIHLKNKAGKTPLMTSSDIETTTAFVEAGANVNDKELNGENILFYMFGLKPQNERAGVITDTYTANDDNIELMQWALEKETKRLEFLLSHGLNINEKNKDGKTAVFFQKDPLAIRILKEHGADLNARDNEGRTALMNTRDPAIAAALIAAGADIQLKDPQGKSVSDYYQNDPALLAVVTHPLHHLHHIEFDDNPGNEIKRIMDRGYDINGKNSAGDTPLMAALKADLHNVASSLIDLGADITIADANGNTPDMVCFLQNAREDIRTHYHLCDSCKRMMAYHEDVAIVNREGYSVLDNLQCQKEEAEEVIALVNAKTINAQDKAGNSILHRILSNSVQDFNIPMQALIKRGADVNLQNHLGQTPLMLAQRGTAIKELILANADIHLKDREGKTAMDYHKDKPELLGMMLYPLTLSNPKAFTLDEYQKLVKNSRDINASDYAGDTPLHVAVKLGEVERVRVLIEAGARPDVKDIQGKTPFDAANPTDPEIIRLLGK